MRSRTFYSKFVKVSFLKQLWVMGLMALAYFVMLLLPLAVMINNWTGMSYQHRSMEEQFMRFMVQADAAYVLVVISAVFIAFIQFSYLHSRRQLDFYGSLSVKRERFFIQRFFFGYIDFVIPYTFILAVCMLIGASRGLMTVKLFVYLLETWIYSQIGFVLIYLVAAIAILLTGRRWVAFLGCGVLLAGGYLLQMLINSANGSFFDTYYYVEDAQVLSHLSPVYILYSLREVIYRLEYAGEFISAEFVYTGVIVLAVNVLLFVLTRYVVRIRPAEKAGQSMAFELPARVIHIGVSVFGGLSIGMITMDFVRINEIIWFFLGTVLGGVFLYVLIQFIYTLDIRRTFTYKWQFLAVELAIAVIGCVYSFDLIGYDTYFPEQERLESVAIRYNDENAYNAFYKDGIYYDGMRFALEEMVLPANDETYEMLSSIVEDQLNDEGHYQHNTSRICVRYRLKNGRTVDRRYQASVSEYKKEFVHFYEQEQYRSVMIPSVILEEELYTELKLYYAGQEHTLFNKASEDLTAFVQAYNRDIKLLDAHVFVEAIPVAELYVMVQMGRDNTMLELPVYDECKETLALIGKLGHDPIGALKPECIAQIEVDDYTYRSGEEAAAEEQRTEDVTEAAAEKMRMYTFTEEAEIAQIVPYLIDDQYHSVWHMRVPDYYVRVYMKHPQSGYEIMFSGEFLAGQLPKELLEESEPAVIY